jgi:alkaline phosphatase
MVKLKPGDTLWYSFIVYKNKAHRNAVNKKDMKEMTAHEMPKVMPYDMKRMAHGGFTTIVQG